MSAFNPFCKSRKILRDGGAGYTETTVIFPRTELALETLENKDGLYRWRPVTAPFVLTEGRNYAVVWNGVRYVRTAIKITFSSTLALVALGNLSLTDDGADTGEPFCVIYVVQGDECFVDILTTAPTATVSISVETIHPVRSEYIPSVVVDFDELGLTNVVLSLLNQGGGEVDLNEDNAYGINLDEVRKAFPLDKNYAVKVTVPDMGTMMVNPVYTLFKDNMLRTAHIDSYIQTNSIQKFYVRIVGYADATIAVEAGFYT